LRVFENRVLSVNLMLPLEIVRIGGGPVAIQSRSNLSVFHIEISLTLAGNVELYVPYAHRRYAHRRCRRAIPGARAAWPRRVGASAAPP
jgi:hypothetical protein